VRLRVTAAATALIALALLVAGVTATRLLRGSLVSSFDDLVDERVDELESLIARDLITPIIEPTGREVGQIQVFDEDGRLRATTRGLDRTTRLDVIAAPASGEQSFGTVDGSAVAGDPDDRYRVVARTVESPSVGPLTIYAVSSLRVADAAARSLTISLLVGLPLLVVFAAALIWWVVGRALKPVDTMRAAVDRIQASDLSERIDVTATDDEIGRLGETLNNMLARLDDAATRQKVFTAAASHELRSPLSAIRTELEVGLAYPEHSDWPLIANEALTEVARLEELARDLLVLTRVRATGLDRSPCDLGLITAGELSRRHREGIEYQQQIAPAVIAADEDMLLQVIRNLLDNAERHARTRIAVAVGAASGANGDDRVELTIVIVGRSMPPADRTRIFDPFTRLDDARTLDDGGSGLGLAIAQNIVTGFDGVLEVMDLDAGAGFRASFPAASHAATAVSAAP
jgi:signal transduction histidine kinase